MRKINTIIIELLKKRGITSEEDIVEFLSEKPQRTYNPFLLHNLEVGVDFILYAISKGKRICIYGDYDADGVTSVSLMYQILSNLTNNLTYYIPSRFEEGYGLNIQAIEKLKAEGVELIITVDCGISSYNEVEYAKNLGIDVIVTDHHSLSEKVPNCIIINPKQKQCQYPFKHLAGVGVAFKFAQGIQKKTNLPKSEINKLLDLVAIGTIGDIVSLTDENRTLVKYGLKIINSGSRQGLKYLINRISLNERNISSENIAFALVPHINAAGRMESALSAAKVMIGKNADEVGKDIDFLIECNINRKKIQEETYRNCIELVNKQCPHDNFILIEAGDAHEGITGIVAGKIKEKYKRPSIIVTDCGNGNVKGTGRSIETINLYELLSNCRDLYVKFGGHAGACGFTMSKENVIILREKINNIVNEMYSNDNSIFDIEDIEDATIGIEEITEEFIKMLDSLAPFGNCNMKPILLLNDVKKEEISYLGDKNQHVKFNARNKRNNLIQCISFFATDKFSKILIEEKIVDLYGYPEYSIWNGNGRIQFIVGNMKGNLDE